MKPIEGANLEDLVKEVSDDIILDQRTEAKTRMRRHFNRIQGLSEEKRRLQNELNKVDEKLKKANDVTEELRKGNWAQLAQLKGDEERDGQKPNGSGSLNPT